MDTKNGGPAFPFLPTQQEAQGAVAWEVGCDAPREGGRVFIAARGVPIKFYPEDQLGDAMKRSDILHGLVNAINATTPPAPVDVRALRELVGRWRKLQVLRHSPAVAATFATCADELLALLDGQPAGVVIDDAMVRRAVHAYDEWMIEHAPDETDAYHDGMRAALTAALGGGVRS